MKTLTQAMEGLRYKNVNDPENDPNHPAVLRMVNFNSGVDQAIELVKEYEELEKHDKKKLLDGFAHPKDCSICRPTKNKDAFNEIWDNKDDEVYDNL